MKKIISLLVVLAMLMTMAPAVFAAEIADYTEIKIADITAESAEIDDGNKYLVRGTITEVKNTIYGNMYIADENGNTLYIYGVYGVDGVDRYDEMETKPVAGDEVLLLGELTTYSGTPQMKNAWVQEINGTELEAGETVPDPEADTELTIAEAIALGKTKAHNAYTEGKYYVTGTVTEVTSTKYGNMYIADEEGNSLLVYGTWSADGATRYDGLERQPVVGDTVTVYGIIGQYNGAAQMKNGWIQSFETTRLFLGNNELTAGHMDENWDMHPEVKDYTYVAENDGTLYITLYAYGYGDVNVGESMLEDTGWVKISINDTLLTGMENTVEVAAGDTVTVTLESVDGDSYFAWINLSYEGFYVEPLGGRFNPIELTPVDCNGAIPYTTPELAAGEELFYNLSDGFSGYTIYIYGEDAYLVTQRYNPELGDWSDYRIDAVDGVVTFEVNWYEGIIIGNAGDEAAAFDVVATIPVGAENNPAELTEGDHTVTLLDNNSGYYFAGVATEAGKLTITITGDQYWQFNLIYDGDPDSWEDDAWYGYGQIYDEPNTLTIDVKPGDYYTLIVSIHDAEYMNIAGTLNVNVAFTPAGEGGEDDEGDTNVDNPIEITFEMNEDYSEGTASVTVPAKSTVYYSAYGVGGMVLTITDAEGNVVDTQTLEGNPRMPVVFKVANKTDAEATYTLTVTYPVGTWSNPAQLVLGYGQVNVTSAGYFYSWTAEEDTLFALTMFGDNWTYCINIEGANGTVYGDTRYSNDENPIYVTVVKVAAGETINLVMGTADWTEAVLAFTATANAGTEADPVYLDMLWNDMGSAASLNADLPAGEYVYSLPLYGESAMLLHVNGELTEYTVVDPMGWDPNVVVINNESEANAVYSLEITYPAGTYFNPDKLEMGDHVAQMIAADYQLAHWYSFTAEEDTLLVLNFRGNNWYYWGMTNDYSVYLDGHAADEDVLVPVQVIKLAAGQTFLLNMGTIDGSETIEFSAATYAGTEEDPILVDFIWNEEWTAASLNIDMPAGEYVLGARGIGAMNLLVNGVETAIVDNGFRYPCTFVVNNEEAGVVALELSYPVGSMANPEIVEEGEFVADIAEGNYDGYFYNFVAPADGVLTVTVSAESGWFFVVNNVTTGIYGDAYWSDDNPAVNTVKIEVKEGDVIEIVVNAFDPENGMGVGGQVNVVIDFVGNDEYTLGDVNGDGAIDTTDAKLIMQYNIGAIEETALNLMAADVNGDGLVDTTDAKLIMQFNIGLIDGFKAEE